MNETNTGLKSLLQVEIASAEADPTAISNDREETRKGLTPNVKFCQDTEQSHIAHPK